MRVLYLSIYYNEFVRYPISKLAIDCGIDYIAYFLHNKYTALRDKVYRQNWDEANVTTHLDKDKYKIIKFWGLPRDWCSWLYGYFFYLRIVGFWFCVFGIRRKRTPNTEIDLIHAHCLHPTGMTAYLLSKKLNIPYIVTTHGVDFYNALSTKGKHTYSSIVKNQVKKVMKEAKAVIAVSEQFAADVRAFCPEANVVVCENTYNSDIFRNYEIGIMNYDKEVEQSKSIPPSIITRHTKTITFISVGYFIERKNHLLILKAFADLVADYPHIRLVLIGSGAMVEEYHNFIAQHKLGDYAQVKDFIPHQMLVSEYHKSDVFILASTSEPFGIVCLEALACGLPVIASNTQGPVKIIEQGKDGLLFENNNLADLKEKMRYLLDNPALYPQMSENAINKAEQYKNKHHTVYQVYTETIKNYLL